MVGKSNKIGLSDDDDASSKSSSPQNSIKSSSSKNSKTSLNRSQNLETEAEKETTTNSNENSYDNGCYVNEGYEADEQTEVEKFSEGEKITENVYGEEDDEDDDDTDDMIDEIIREVDAAQYEDRNEISNNDHEPIAYIPNNHDIHPDDDRSNEQDYNEPLPNSVNSELTPPHETQNSHQELTPTKSGGLFKRKTGPLKSPKTETENYQNNENVLSDAESEMDVSVAVDTGDDEEGGLSDSAKFRSIREARMRQRKSIHNMAFRRQSTAEDMTDDVVNDIVSSPDQGTLNSRSSAIREMPTSLRHKRSIRDKVATVDRKKLKKPSWIKRTGYALSMALRHFRAKIAALTYSLGFWQGHLKTVEGHFGTGVASYFIFLRVLFLLNVPLFILSFSFIVIPQLLYRFLQQVPDGYTQNETFTGLELLTGGGWFENTVMYYGYYINGTINVFTGHHNGSWFNLSGASYNMQYAYLLTCGGFYLLCLIILGSSVARSYRENYVDSSGSIQEHFIVKVLSGWNFTITEKSTADLRQKFMYKEMREYLSTTKKTKRRKSCGEWCHLILIRIITNIVCVGLIAGSGWLIWYLYSSQSLKTDLKFLREMAPPLCVSAFNIVMPAAFSMIGTIERYGKPRVTLYLALVRTLFMKGVTLGVLIYVWLVQLNCHQKNIEGLDLKTAVEVKKCIPCWETYMGQEIYRLVLVDFFTYIVSVILFELFRRLMSNYCCKGVCGSKPEFDIGRNTLDLIYSQALCWLGTFYSPLLSLIQLIKLFILFYIKKTSVMQNCSPSQKPWRAARTNTVFLAFLFSAFLMMAFSVAMSIIVITPSTTCGPFRGLNSTYDIIIDLVMDWRDKYPALSALITFFTSEGAISGLIITLTCFVYYLRIMAKGRQELVGFLLHQVRLEGRDKNFLLRQYQAIQTQSTLPRRYLPRKPATTSLPKVTIEHEPGATNGITNSDTAVSHPPTPYTEITPSSESVLPLTDYSDGQTPNSMTPSSETPGASHSVSPKSVTLAITPESEHSDEITARELTNQETSSVTEVPDPDYLSSEELPAPDYDGGDEMVEMQNLGRRPNQLRVESDHEGYEPLWKS